MSQEKSQKSKPLFFISHAHHDQKLAAWLKRKIISFFSKTVDVFVSSMPEDNKKGKKWFDDTLMPNLQKCDIFISLITPVSIKKHWMWFELGIVWSNTIKTNIYPICLGVDAPLIPMPLSEIQATILEPTAETEIIGLFTAWCEILNGGDISKLRAKPSLTELYKVYEEIYAHSKLSIQTNSDVIEAYENNLTEALEVLIDIGKINATNLSLFKQFGVLSQDRIDRLRQIALQVAKQKSS
ncbi:MAG: toll/interleukin-1 receptor domain-containing protein [bacterium]|nr:toll/interleukin-1 receptor domain-containing protein [bacterium]